MKFSTESLARISSRRPLITIGIWGLLVLVAGGIILNLLPTATTTELRYISTFTEVESQKANDLLEAGQLAPPLSEAVIVQSETLTVEEPAFRSKVEDLTSTLLAIGPEVVVGGFNYYLINDERLVSADRKTTIISLQLAGSIAEATQNAEEILHVVQEADHSDEFRVLVAGDATIAFETVELSASDLEQGERIGIPVALLILLVLFGAVVAALIPIGLAIASIIVALAVVALIGNIFGELVFFVLLWITMIGLAVGIDYCLFVVSRFREELARGLSTSQAVAKVGATANRTALFSGVTVVIALIGILIIPHTLFFSMALGAITVVIVSVRGYAHTASRCSGPAWTPSRPPAASVHQKRTGRKDRGISAGILGIHNVSNHALPRNQRACSRGTDDLGLRVLPRHQPGIQQRRGLSRKLSYQGSFRGIGGGVLLRLRQPRQGRYRRRLE